MMLRVASLARRPTLRQSGLRDLALRACSTASKSGTGTPERPPPSDEQPAATTSNKTDATSSAAAPPPPPEPEVFPSTGPMSSQGRGLVLQPEEEENLPPLAFEPGVVGAAQKGVSAVVIAFGAAALGACVWGASQALFPSATSTQSIFSEALDKVKDNGDVAFALGTPLRAFGADHGGSRGRRNAMERWELNEAGAEVVVVRFHVSGPQGMGTVQVQVPANRKRGEFNYIIFENARNRRMVHVLDDRGGKDAQIGGPPPPAPAAAPASG